MQTKIVDSFGDEIRLVFAFSESESGIEVLKRAIRFALDGEIEGIASGLLDGRVDDDCLKYFGLIA